MRDFRDAKAMAQTLREALAAKAITISHSESLEFVSKILGVSDWNVLSALLQAEPKEPQAGAATYPALPMRDLVGFPTMTFPLFIGRKKTLEALALAFNRQREVVLVTQRDPSINEPVTADMHGVGVLASLIDFLRLPDGTAKVLALASRRVKIRQFTSEETGYSAEVEDIFEGPIPDAAELMQKAVMQFQRYWTGGVPPMSLESLRMISNPGRLANSIGWCMKWPIPDKQTLLETIDPIARLETVITLLDKELAASPA